MTYTATIDGTKIVDWETFHDEFQRVMGFFEGYGRNMDAWIDCMSDMFISGGLTKFDLNKGDVFILKVSETEEFQRRCPEIFSEFMACAACVNKDRNDTQLYLELR
jgi:Barstar (barnase inhibitor)